MPSHVGKSDDIQALLFRKKQAECEAFLKHYTRRSGVLLDKNTAIIRSDALDWLHSVPDACLHAVVTDPPRDPAEIEILVGEATARGEGVRDWNISPSLETITPFHTATFVPEDKDPYRDIRLVYEVLGRELMRVLVPGAHVFVGADPVLSTPMFSALMRAGLEKRCEIVRVFNTGVGGTPPPDANSEFPDVTLLPRLRCEPWGLFMKPLEMSPSANLRKWHTGALRRLLNNEPLSDLVPSSLTPVEEFQIAPYPALKPQAFLRRLVWASLPLGLGIVVDPFAGGGATLAAAAALGYMAIGVERRTENFAICCNSFARLKEIRAEEV